MQILRQKKIARHEKQQRPEGDAEIDLSVADQFDQGDEYADEKDLHHVPSVHVGDVQQQRSDGVGASTGEHQRQRRDQRKQNAQRKEEDDETDQKADEEEVLLEKRENDRRERDRGDHTLDIDGYDREEVCHHEKDQCRQGHGEGVGDQVGVVFVQRAVASGTVGGLPVR